MRIENAINDAVDYFMENPSRSSTGLPSQTDVRLVLNDLVGEEGYGRASQSASVKKVMVRLKKLSKNLLMENPRRVRRNPSGPITPASGLLRIKTTAYYSINREGKFTLLRKGETFDIVGTSEEIRMGRKITHFAVRTVDGYLAYILPENATILDRPKVKMEKPKRSEFSRTYPGMSDIRAMQQAIKTRDDGIRDLAIYLQSSKFRNDTTVQVRDVLNRLQEIYR